MQSGRTELPRIRRIQQIQCLVPFHLPDNEKIHVHGKSRNTYIFQIIADLALPAAWQRVQKHHVRMPLGGQFVRLLRHQNCHIIRQGLLQGVQQRGLTGGIAATDQRGTP